MLHSQKTQNNKPFMGLFTGLFTSHQTKKAGIQKNLGNNLGVMNKT